MAEAFMDGEYDPGMVYEELERRRNKAVNKPRSNARSDAGPPAKNENLLKTTSPI